jgi:hypothetical protein
MWDSIKHFATVAALTWLIWWSADRRVTDRVEMPLRLAVKSADQSIIATIESPLPAEVIAVLTGTRGRLDAFRTMLDRRPGMPFECVWPADDVVVGTRSVSSRRLLSESRSFRDSGLDIAEIRPAEVVVLIDKLTTRRMEIQPDFGSVRVENVVCQPPAVEVGRLPSMLSRSRYADGILRPAAEQAVRQWLATHPDDAEFAIDLSLSIPEAAQTVEFSPTATVRVSGRFVSLFASAVKGPVQIVFAVPPDVEKQYILKPADTSNFRPDVHVRGPAAEIEKLTPQQIFLFVEVRASDVSATSKTVRRAPRAILPPGFELDRELQEVEFDLVERPAVSDNTGG